MKVHVQRTVHANLSRVFALFTSADAYAAAHAGTCRSLTYRADSKTTATTEEEWLYGGRTFRIRHRVSVIPPNLVLLDTIGGIGTGAQERVRVKPVSGGTRVRYEVTFSLPGLLGPVLEPLVAIRVRSLVEKLANEDVLAIERRSRTADGKTSRYEN
jgi:hypothetical protein